MLLVALLLVALAGATSFYSYNNNIQSEERIVALENEKKQILKRATICEDSVVKVNQIKCENDNEKNNELYSAFTEAKKSSWYNDFCDEEDCMWYPKLEYNKPVGLFSVSGYYDKYTDIGFGDVTKECDAFFITEGSSLYLEHIKRKAHDIDFIFIDLDSMPSEYQDLLKNSNEKEVVNAIIFNYSFGDYGAQLCKGHTDILRVTK